MKIAVHTFFFANDTFYIWLLAVLTGLYFLHAYILNSLQLLIAHTMSFIIFLFTLVDFKFITFSFCSENIASDLLISKV